MSHNSIIIAATRLRVVPIFVGAITDLLVTAFTDTTISLTWTNPDSTYPLDHFKIILDGVESGVTTDDSNSWTITGLAPSTTYSMQLVAVDDQNNEGGLSNSISEKTYATQTQEVINRAIMELFTLPSLTGLRALDDLLISSINTEDFWTSRAVLYYFRYNDVDCANFSRINLKNPSGALMSVHGGMSYGVDGWTGNGVDGYLNTRWNPYTDGISTDNNIGFTTMMYDDFPITGARNGVSYDSSGSGGIGLGLLNNGFYYLPVLGSAVGQWVGAAKRAQFDIYSSFRISDTQQVTRRNKTEINPPERNKIGTLSSYNGEFFINALNDLYNSEINNYITGTTGLFSAGGFATKSETDKFFDDINTMLTAVGLTPTPL